MGKLILKKDDCEKWAKHKNKNPISGYTLKQDSKLLKEITKQCTEILGLNKKADDKSKSPKPLPHPKPVSPVSKAPFVKQEENSPLKGKKGRDNDVFALHYPDLDDPNFAEKMSSLKEFAIHQIPEYPDINSIEDFNKMSDKLCGIFEKSYYQHFVSQYISYRSPYRSILLYHGVGVGKTCSAITLAEAFLVPHNTYQEPKIWVIMPHALKTSFKNQIFDVDETTFETLANQCTGDTYIKLLNINKNNFGDSTKIKANLKKLIKSRYRLFSYDAFAKFIQTENAGQIVKDKVIIIDEAHNIRSTEKEAKDVFTALKDVLANGINNRLVLLSATPMYNEPRDILDLFHLLLLNDKRFDMIDKDIFVNLSVKIDDKVLRFIKKLVSNYVSYLKGKNPFTFALKLSPKYSNIPVLEKAPNIDPFGKSIPMSDTSWLEKIEDGIVPSTLGEKQLQMIETLKGLNENNIFNNLQPMNIVYDTDIGEAGFYTFFSKAKDTDPLCVRYNSKYINALMPDEEHLGKYSGKFLNICNFIRKSKGIVVIYSRYRYSGIVPLAICLEHLGYSREGTNNILEKPDIIKNHPKYDGIKSPRYCILSSENKDIMGSTTIDSLIQKINNPANKDGSLIKVILITPVASEGLSFYNAREIHLIEPWYHFNRAVQIIGRGIRNCRHQGLPFEEKNVSVFMHASVASLDKESIDLHALRISTRKYSESQEIDSIINSNSIDCVLMKNINYFPKSLFKLGKTPITTSQGVRINYEYGDDEKQAPKCSVSKLSLNYSGYRKETYKHLIINMQTLLRKIVLQAIKDNKYYIPISELSIDINIDDKIFYETILASVYPNILIDGYVIIPHQDGLHIMTIALHVPQTVSIVFENEEDKKVQVKDDKKIEPPHINIDRGNINNATIALYSSLDAKTFENMMQRVMHSDMDEAIEYMAECLFLQGALVRYDELKSFKNNDNKYIGYVNIFNLKDVFDVILYNKNDNKYRDATDKEKDEIMKARKKHDEVPQDMTKEVMSWGIFTPKKIKNKDDVINIFKLFTIGEAAGKKTGIDCTSLKKNEHIDIFKELNIRDIDGTKLQNCIVIANELLQKGRLTLLPYYKPK
jgi:superfamily II DNA or RNA helicase